MAGQVAGAEVTFLDQNGDPLSGGLVYFYVNGTSTLSTTWRDPGQTVVNPNPIVLDQAGRAMIWGTGLYRQVVTDQFGNVQWDAPINAGDYFPADVNFGGNVHIAGQLNVDNLVHFAQALTVGGDIIAQQSVDAALDVNVGRTLNVTGAANLNGGANVTGNLGVSGNVVLNNGAVINAPPGDKLGLHVVGGNIIVTGVDRPSLSASNLTDMLTMGMWESNKQLAFGVTDGITGTPVTTFATIDGVGGTAGAVRTYGDVIVGSINPGADSAHTVIVRSGNSPSFAMHNLVDGSVYGMWNASNELQWGRLDVNGFPVTSFMSLNSAGLLSIGNITATNVAVTSTLTFAGGGGSFTTEVDFHANTIFFGGANYPGGAGVNWGTPSFPWNNVYSHAFTTVSTDVTSELLANGQLEVVRSVPVRTEPHIGISADEAKVIAGAVGEDGIGTSYNVLVGVLWKALQELSEKFDAYVAAHP